MVTGYLLVGFLLEALIFNLDSVFIILLVVEIVLLYRRLQVKVKRTHVLIKKRKYQTFTLGLHAPFSCINLLYIGYFLVVSVVGAKFKKKAI